MKTTIDVPSPINLQDPNDALQWANEVNVKRPWRYDFFNYYVNFINQLEQFDHHLIQVLEIGSGPGFLAKQLLQNCPYIHYTAFDFSEAMHNLSKSLLSENELLRTSYILGDFKNNQWNKNLSKYDVVIIHQALHELRHKDYAENFHREIYENMYETSTYFVCDHICAENAMTNGQLYMNKEEHFLKLKNAKFNHIQLVMEHTGLCLFEIKKS